MNEAAVIPVRTNASVFLDALLDRGVRHVFANSGTDFAPLIESLATAVRAGVAVPRFHAIPHENLAVSMAHGYHLVSGEPAAVMVHVTVGTANALCGIMNAARDHIPLLVVAGRTPNTESGHAGSRSVGIHWGQDAFDQAGMLREYVKWEYEMRSGQDIDVLVQRALDIAMSEPRGPVYLTLPREVLADPARFAARAPRDRPLGACAPAPQAAAIDQAAETIIGAEFPVLVTASLGRDVANVARLSYLAGEFGIGVAHPGEPGARDVNIPMAHPLFLGTHPVEALERADVIVVIDCEVPWWPRSAAPRPDARLVHIGPDPLHARIPLRGFEMDQAIAGSSSAALLMLQDALQSKIAGREAHIAARRARLAASARTHARNIEQIIQRASSRRPVHPAWIAACINRVKDADTIIVNEMGVQMDWLDLHEPGSYITTSLSAGLGQGLGAALGAKLAAPESTVILLVGDGSYLFGNPLAAHLVARADGLPTLTIVVNNGRWHAVHRATAAMYPDGLAARMAEMPLVALRPAPDYERTIESCGGLGLRVEDPARLPDAIAHALRAVSSGTPALINVISGEE